MARVFVLNAGRSGSTTFVRACEHIENFSAGHETLSDRVGPDRFAYPDDHVEADNRLAWFLGSLEAAYGADPFYVHLTRDREQVARSFAQRWRVDDPEPVGTVRRAVFRRHHRHPAPAAIGARIIDAFAHAIVMRPKGWTKRERLDVCRFYVDAVTANIDHFLEDKPRKMTIALERIDEAFPAFWEWIGARGDLDAAMGEWTVRHNESRSRRTAAASR
jgi:hypothetical protein